MSVDSRQYLQKINGCLLLCIALLTIHSHPNIRRYLTNAFEEHQINQEHEIKVRTLNVRRPFANKI